MNRPEKIQTLRRAFTSYPQGVAACEEELAPERIWQALTGELPAAERRDVVAHTATCPACAEAWRLARFMRTEATGSAPVHHMGRGPEEGSQVVAGPWKQYLPHVLAAVAAALLITVGAGVIPGPWGAPEPIPTGIGETPTMRGDAGEQALASEIEAGAELPREDFRLRWEPASQKGARYKVTVMTEDLETVVTARGLEEPVYRVPPERFEGLDDGTRLLWQVEARLPSGEQETSASHTNVLG